MSGSAVSNKAQQSVDKRFLLALRRNYMLTSFLCKVVTTVSVEEWMTIPSPSWSEDSQELDPNEDSQATRTHILWSKFCF